MISNEAKYHLKESNEFYPFAYVLKNGTLVSTNVYSGIEKPDVQLHLVDIEKALTKYQTYAIGINSSFKDSISGAEIDIIEIRITVDKESYKHCAIPYEIMNDGNIKIYDLFELE